MIRIYARIAITFLCIGMIHSISAMEPVQNCELVGSVNIGDSQLIQVSVLDQFSTKGSSRASCAYHAYRISSLVAKILLQA